MDFGDDPSSSKQCRNLSLPATSVADMAEGEEKKKDIVVGGGEEKNGRRFPPGFRFSPTDDELIEYYLLPRLQGRPHEPNDAVIDDYVYRYHPDDLILKGNYKRRGQDNTWYFLSSRARKYVNGDRPSRMTEDGRGRWKASTGSKSAVTGGDVNYTFSVLAYHDGPIKKEHKGKWLMRELTIPEYEKKIDKQNGGDRSTTRDTLDEYVMCKIYMTKRKRKKKNKGGDEAGPSGTCEEDTCPAAPPPWPVESRQDTAKPSQEETARQKRRKGKRPIEEAAQPKRAPPTPGPYLGPQSGPGPAQFYGDATQTQARFGTTGYQYHHYGGSGTGRPMVYNPHTSMPRPPAPMAFNGQAPPYQAASAAAPGVFGQAMMTQHLGPSGQAFRSPLPPTVPAGYPVMQRQPETEEMREMRVYRQHMNEMMMRGMMQQQKPACAAYPAQQPRPMAFMQQQRQPYFGAGGVNHQYVSPMSPMGPQYLPCSYQQPVEEVGQQVQCTYTVPDSGAIAATPAETEAGNVVGATNQGTDARGDCNNDEEKASVEAATNKVLPGGRTAPTDGDDTPEDPPH